MAYKADYGRLGDPRVSALLWSKVETRWTKIESDPTGDTAEGGWSLHWVWLDGWDDKHKPAPQIVKPLHPAGRKGARGWVRLCPLEACVRPAHYVPKSKAYGYSTWRAWLELGEERGSKHRNHMITR